MSILIANQPGMIDASMIVFQSGAAFDSGSVRCFVKRNSDGKWLKSDASWVADKPAGGDIPTMTHISGGLWTLAHTPANASDIYQINCIDSGATCIPDNRVEEVVFKGADKKALISTDAQDLSTTLKVALSTSNQAVLVLLSALLLNKKEITKVGNVCHLIIYDTDGTTPLIDKVLQDINGNNIDIAAQQLAKELASSI